MRRKLDIFHIVMILAFVVEFTIDYILELIDTILGSHLLTLYENSSFSFDVERFSIMSLVIIFLFIAGCIKAKVARKTRTLNYWIVLIIVFVNVFFLFWFNPLQAALFIAIALTRKYWEVADKPPVTSSFRNWDVFHKLIPIVFPLLFILPITIASVEKIPGEPWTKITLLEISAAILTLFILGCIRAKRSGRTTIDASLIAFMLLISGLLTAVLGVGFVLIIAAIAVLLTRRWWEVKPMEHNRLQESAKNLHGHDPQGNMEI